MDCYNHNEFDKYCNNCKSDLPFWVKRIYNDYKVIHIGCSGCGYNHNTEFIKCEMCNSNNTPLCVMETNKININICKNCDIDLFSNGNIYLSVPFNLKDEVQKLGANWDNKYKKWFINKNHKNIDMILQKFKRIW